ncbi:MAG: N-acetylglucosaminyl-phosphatidylinositol de-N-acetylase [Thelocarpon impressellum]|nr:MAG: N-acetylglucosaminyl-phosphatidylinositol de-N-acetylase [Thelocarpon impressellum]
MQWLTALLVPALLAATWAYTAQVTRSAFPPLRRKRLCLLIAHPDDEAMFFAPTLLALTAAGLGNEVKILCLSSGDADGLGEIRKKELVKSGLALGLRREEDVMVIEDPKFPDSMTSTWDAKAIADVLSRAFAPDPSSPRTTIDVLVTFDRDGVSSHPNHISLYHGARAFLSAVYRRRPSARDATPMPELYTLTSTSIARKYLSVLDVAPTMLLRVLGGKGKKPLLFVNSPLQYRTAQRAMTNAHRSQMRWFRWGWIGASRYMVVNDLKLDRLSAEDK